MTKTWQAYAQHILDVMEKLRRTQQRGAIVADEILYAATLRHLQTLAEGTQRLPDRLKRPTQPFHGKTSAGFGTYWYTTTLETSTRRP